MKGRLLPWFTWLSGNGGLNGLFLIQTFNQHFYLWLHWQSLFRATRCLPFLRISKVLPNEFICFWIFPVISTYLSASGLLRSQLLLDQMLCSLFLTVLSIFSPVFMFIFIFIFILKKYLSCCHFCDVLWERRDKHIHMFYSLPVAGDTYLKFGCHFKDFYCSLKFIFYRLLSLKN